MMMQIVRCYQNKSSESYWFRSVNDRNIEISAEDVGCELLDFLLATTCFVTRS